jgi:hypothetical protein
MMDYGDRQERAEILVKSFRVKAQAEPNTLYKGRTFDQIADEIENMTPFGRERVSIACLGSPHPRVQEANTMMWLIKDLDRWGYSLNVVRAPTEKEALKLACPNGIQHPSLVEVIPLPMVGEPAILWCHEESPDSPRD